jgi:GNAT superfamily N-acetyltransferase
MAGVIQSASNKTSGGAVAESFLTNDNTKRISDRGFGFMSGEILSLAMRAKSSYSQFANVRSACQQIVTVIVRLQNSNAAVTALVDSLRHDPFYVAITQQFRNDEGRRRRALARYFDYSMSEGVRIGRLVVWPDASVGAAVWLLPTETSTYNAELEAKSEFLEECIGTSSRDVYARIMEFMVPRASAAVDSSSWYLSIVGVAPSSQGQGIGARLLEPTLREADKAGVDCYLETFDHRNPRFYQRLGFSTIGTHEEPVTGSPYTIMRRRPLDRRPSHANN